MAPAHMLAPAPAAVPLGMQHPHRWHHHWNFVHKEDNVANPLFNMAAERGNGSMSCWVDSLSSCSSSLSCTSTSTGSIHRTENAAVFQSNGNAGAHFEPLHSTKMEWVWPPVGWSEMDRKRAARVPGVGKTLLNLEQYESPPPEDKDGLDDDSELTMGPGDPYKMKRRRV
uniref:Uncharacterized protein n=1 Tax=Guillardia theta TaxID=55529 RepID=A0A7S4U7S4_GUITH